MLNLGDWELQRGEKDGGNCDLVGVFDVIFFLFEVFFFSFSFSFLRSNLHCCGEILLWGFDLGWLGWKVAIFCPFFRWAWEGFTFGIGV